MTKLGAGVWVALALVATVACGSPASPPAAKSPAAASPLTPAAGSTTQGLTFTGPVAGQLTNAITTCKLLLSGAQLGMNFEGRIGNQRATFTIQVNSGYKGPGAYAVGAPIDGGANVALSTASYTGASAAGAGDLIVNPPDGKTGTINANLSGGEHVAGTYACDTLTT